MNLKQESGMLKTVCKEAGSRADSSPRHNMSAKGGGVCGHSTARGKAFQDNENGRERDAKEKRPGVSGEDH